MSYKKYLLTLVLLFTLQVKAAPTEPQLRPILILLDSSVPLLNRDGTSSAFGAIVNKAKVLLARKNIPYKTKLMPWKRIMRQMEQKDNIIIIGLIRTHERENNYHWLNALRVVDYKLISLNALPYTALSRRDVVNGDYTVVCETGTAQCEFLRQFGFHQQNILSISEARVETFEKLLIHKRVDFIVSPLDEAYANLKSLGYPQSIVYPLFTIEEMEVYMAASRLKFNSRYVKLLSSH